MNPTTVSLFCGAGGESAGKELAFRQLGIRTHDMVSHAVNHWDLAVQTHGQNFPSIHVHHEDITAVTAATYGLKKINLLWASPSCVHHSRARGGKPRDDQQRSHADEVVERWLKVADVDVLLIENVSEFQDWGPLDDRGQPIKERKGEFYRRFLANLTALGYRYESRILCAADYGDPTTRKRFFLQAVKDGRPITWPNPTHRNPKAKPGLFDAELPPWRTAAECIDWTIPVPSIFDRKKPLAEATLRRIAAGINRYVLHGKPFIVKVNHKYEQFRGQSVDDPFQTITAENGWGVVEPFLAGVGGRAAQSRPRPMSEPVGVITTKADQVLVTPLVARLRGTNDQQIDASTVPANEPVSTISAGGIHSAFVSPLMVKYHGEKKPGEVRGQSVEDPLKTLDTSNRMGLITPVLVQTSYGEREGQAPRALDIEQPLGTVVAGGQKHAMAAAFLAKHNTGVIGQVAEKPLGTVTGIDHHSLVAASLISIDNSSAPGVAPADDPLSTVIASNPRHAIVASFLAHYYGTHNTSSPDEPLDTVTTVDRHSLVTVEIDGETYVIVDIGMRMFEPKELARAMGFPDDFVWSHPDGTPLSKRDQVKMIGNACPVNTVAALIREIIVRRPEVYQGVAA